MMVKHGAISLWFFVLIAMSAVGIAASVLGFFFPPRYSDYMGVSPLKIEESLQRSVLLRKRELEQIREQYLMRIRAHVRTWSTEAEIISRPNAFDPRIQEHLFTCLEAGMVTMKMTGSCIDLLGVPNNPVMHEVDIESPHWFFSVSPLRQKAERWLEGMNTILLEWHMAVEQELSQSP